MGVESICRVLGEHGAAVAPSTHDEAASRPPSKRALRDDQLRVKIARVHEANYGVYGPRKVWLALNREGITVARCTVERLMRDLGLAGARRGTAFKGHGADRIDYVLAVDRDRQRAAIAAHTSQAVPSRVLWRRLQLLGTPSICAGFAALVHIPAIPT